MKKRRKQTKYPNKALEDRARRLGFELHRAGRGNNLEAHCRLEERIIGSGTPEFFSGVFDYLEQAYWH